MYCIEISLVILRLSISIFRSYIFVDFVVLYGPLECVTMTRGPEQGPGVLTPSIPPFLVGPWSPKPHRHRHHLVSVPTGKGIPTERGYPLKSESPWQPGLNTSHQNGKFNLGHFFDSFYKVVYGVFFVKTPSIRVLFYSCNNK